MEFELWYEQILNFPQQVAGSIQKVNRESCDSENKFYLYYSPGIGSKEGAVWIASGHHLWFFPKSSFTITRSILKNRPLDLISNIQIRVWVTFREEINIKLDDINYGYGRVPTKLYLCGPLFSQTGTWGALPFYGNLVYGTNYNKFILRLELKEQGVSQNPMSLYLLFLLIFSTKLDKCDYIFSLFYLLSI